MAVDSRYVCDGIKPQLKKRKSDREKINEWNIELKMMLDDEKSYYFFSEPKSSKLNWD